jgi:hypothetical protein
MVPAPSTPSAYRRALCVASEQEFASVPFDIKTAVGIPEYSYSSYRAAIEEMLPGANCNIIPAMQQIFAEIMRLSSRGVLNGVAPTPTPRDSYRHASSVDAQETEERPPPAWQPQSALTLDQFEALQTQQYQQTTSIIENESFEKVKNAILDAFDLQCELVDESGGHVTKAHSKAIFYEFVCVSNLMRRHALEASVMNAVRNYVELFEQFALDPVPAELIDECEAYMKTAPPPEPKKNEKAELAGSTRGGGGRGRGRRGR